jgi:SAM-dependent methyltransferase
MARAAWTEAWIRRYYRNVPGWIDGTEQFHRLCSATIPRGARILEVGSGPENPTSRFLASLGELHGLDPDPAVLSNSALRTASVLEGTSFPFESESFDACVSDYVAEHLEDPASHLAEVRRVLRPGSPYVFRTPNLFHYVPIVSFLTPHSIHKLLANRLRGHPPGHHDPYPTFYRWNTRRRIRRMATAAGFTVDRMETIEKEPSYGQASRLLFLLFLAYERAVNATALASGLRSNILAVIRRPSR